MRKKKKRSFKIKGSDIVLNSPGKLGRHLEQVRAGVGAYKNLKKYNRKKKHKNEDED